ncbi:hypothetical protein FGO68_gene12460 [Halteria grandinella]|uniref:Cyclin-like domain-containing protein n=1 Tax=Halteria grandinella TaxID=5974 RepID=A0A8J8NU12_HALGN|nr:hypothetical protein FGO68_gene12460 [Halteria grandinella]
MQPPNKAFYHIQQLERLQSNLKVTAYYTTSMTSSNIIRLSHLQGNHITANLAQSFKLQRASVGAHSRANSQEGLIFKCVKNNSAEETQGGRVSLGAVLPSQRQQLPLIKVKTSTHSRESSMHKQFINRGEAVKKYVHPRIIVRGSHGLFSGEQPPCKVSEGGRTRQNETLQSEYSTSASSNNSSDNPFEVALPAGVRMNRDLVSDYGMHIEKHLLKIECQNAIKPDHLSKHELKPAFRAKMVDWMTEVLNIAFRNICCDQTLFLAVNILDRYIQSYEDRGLTFKAQELHLTGVVCMFIASKYEDVQPLLLKTVFEKIGHSKLSKEVILAKEQDILQALGFRVGCNSSILDFINLQFETLSQLRDHCDKQLLFTISVYLAKMSLLHPELYPKKASQLASASIFVSNKIYEQMMALSQQGKQKPCNVLPEKFLLENLTQSPEDIGELIITSKRLLNLAQNFEAELPGLKNLQNLYLPKLEQMVAAK